MTDPKAQTDTITGLGRGLRDLADKLTHLVSPNEAAFMTTGETLGAARDRLLDARNQFQRLSEHLESDKGNTTRNTFSTARDTLTHIAQEAHSLAAQMATFRHNLQSIRRPLAGLAGIITEIAALATNAKVQAAQVRTRSIDFTVFTTDIDRLREMAAVAVRRASERLTSIETGVERATKAAEGFQGSDARELGDIARHMGQWIAEIGRRREQSRRGLSDMDKVSLRIAERVAACIGRLQINDMTCQRIDHVTTALTILAQAISPDTREHGDMHWLTSQSPQRQNQISAAICELQARQTERAMSDFSEAVTDLKRNLDGLSADSQRLGGEARRLFGGSQGRDSFMHTVYADVERVSDLLQRFSETNGQVRRQIAEMAQSFVEMDADLRDIHSIDADMRVMGLNATFKCARLGSAGMALGVVAQELRYCSRRTDETTKAIATAIQAATRDAALLSEKATQQHADVVALSTAMTEGTATVRDIDAAITAGLADLDRICTEVCTLLDTGGVRNLDPVGVRNQSHDLSRQLRALGSFAAPEGIDADMIRDDLERMLEKSYTMQSERVIHELFADHDAPSPVTHPTPNAVVDEDIDACFF